MESNTKVKINLKGGILPMADLNHIVSTGKKHGIKELLLGERGNIFLIAGPKSKEALKTDPIMENYDIEFGKELFPNIVSSYPTEDVFSSATWVTSQTYREALESFHYKPTLQVNIIDKNQTLIPLFGGNLNYISSIEKNYWFLYIKHSNFKGLQKWPFLIASKEIGKISEFLEKELQLKKDLDINSLSNKFNTGYDFKNISSHSSQVPETLEQSSFAPLKGGSKNYWLSKPKRDDSFSIVFLEDLTKMCIDLQIESTFITTWKSLIIKGIPLSSKPEWEQFLGYYKNQREVKFWKF